ncbi:hypothetical protein ACIQZG_04585 [Lysinibacillus sp. NPDC096418]|uniref:hypothetical protein n=1 Tax=Lysinibacillus sp. NPDC096418 TaxID=3364138 RepID=UPI0038202054
MSETNNEKPKNKGCWNTIFKIGAPIVIVGWILNAVFGEDEEVKPKDADKKEEVVAEVKQETPIEEAVSSVVKKGFEVRDNDGVIIIDITDKKLHSGSKRSMNDKSLDIYANLSKIDGIKTATITWYTKLTDQYGNEGTGEVLKIIIDREIFDKVNWSNRNKLDLEKIAPIYQQHQSLND